MQHSSKAAESRVVPVQSSHGTAEEQSSRERIADTTTTSSNTTAVSMDTYPYLQEEVGVGGVGHR